MTNYSQRDPKWVNEQLGNSNLTLGTASCLITCLAILSDKTPSEVNTLLKTNNGFSGPLVIVETAAKLLGLRYLVDRTTPLLIPCIAVTDHFAPKFPTHFFVDLGNGRIIDPLDGQTKSNPYNIIGYRNVSPVIQEAAIPQEGDTITQEMKDREKIFALWQAGTGNYPDQQGVDITGELAHIAAIKQAKLNDGQPFAVADCEQWRQYTLEKIQQGTFKF